MKNYAVEEDAIHGGGILCIMRKPNSITVLLLIQAIFYFLSTSPARRLYPNIYQMLQILLKKYLLSIEKMFFLLITAFLPFSFNEKFGHLVFGLP